MAEEKDATSVPLSQGAREDEEGRDPEDPLKTPPTAPDSSTRRVSVFLPNLPYSINLCVFIEN